MPATAIDVDASENADRGPRYTATFRPLRTAPRSAIVLCLRRRRRRCTPPAHPPDRPAAAPDPSDDDDDDELTGDRRRRRRRRYRRAALRIPHTSGAQNRGHSVGVYYTRQTTAAAAIRTIIIFDRWPRFTSDIVWRASRRDVVDVRLSDLVFFKHFCAPRHCSGSLRDDNNIMSFWPFGDCGRDDGRFFLPTISSSRPCRLDTPVGLSRRRSGGTDGGAVAAAATTTTTVRVVPSPSSAPLPPRCNTPYTCAPPTELRNSPLGRTTNDDSHLGRRVPVDYHS